MRGFAEVPPEGSPEGSLEVPPEVPHKVPYKVPLFSAMKGAQMHTSGQVVQCTSNTFQLATFIESHALLSACQFLPRTRNVL